MSKKPPRSRRNLAAAWLAVIGACFASLALCQDTPKVGVEVDGKVIGAGGISVRGSAQVRLTGPPDPTDPNGVSTILFTLDGSDPEKSGLLFETQFTVKKSSTLRAVAYDRTFQHIAKSDPLKIVILPTLTALTEGGGTVAVNPPAGAYSADGTATVTAKPGEGWTFLEWLGDHTGTKPVITVNMSSNDKWVHAVFGTGLSSTVIGSGRVEQSPAPATYPHGTIVRLTAIPAAGNYFARWGNDAKATDNPRYVTVDTASQNVTAVFAALPEDQHALTVQAVGFGRVSSNPNQNLFADGAEVTLTPQPDSGQSFLSWSGDASGTQNPLTVTMSSSMAITANFTKRPRYGEN